MADLNIIYKIAADVSGLKSGVDRAAAATEGLGSMAATVGKSLASAFTITAVVQLGKDLIATADALVTLSAKTGITIEALQLLQAAGDDAGNSIEEMAGAVNQLQNRLAEGDQSAVAALRALGLEVENFLRLTPDQQFMRISEAIRRIEDPAERVRLAVDLFGKQGMSILPTLTRGFDDLKGSVHVMSEQTAKDLEAAGSAIVAWGRTAKNVLAEAVVGLKNIITYNEGTKLREARIAAEELAASLKKAGDEAARLARQNLLPKGLTVTAPTGTALTDLERDLDRQIQTQIEANKAAQDAAEAQKRHNRELREYHNWLVLREFEDAAAQIKREADAVAEATRNQELFNRTLFYGGSQLETMTDLMRAQEKALQTPAGTGWLTGLNSQIETFSQTFGSKMFAGFGDFLQTDMPAMILKAFQGGGDVVKTIGSAFGAFFTQKDSVFQKAVSGMFGKEGLGGTIGKALGSIVPMIGPLLGPLLDKVGGFFKNLFGGKEKETNKTREAFVQLSGGLDALNQKAAAAGVTLTAMLNAKTPEAYKKAIDELTAAFEFQDSAMATLDETVQRYGFTIEELGPAFARQDLEKRAQRLYQDFKVLAAAGVPVAGIIGKMGKSINEFAQDAIRTGTEVPAAMKPMLQQMIDHGELLDENGNAYTSLEETGLSFSETMTQGFAKLIQTVDRLTDAIARGLGIALDNLPDEKNIDVNVNVNRTDTIPSTPDENGAPRVGIPGGPIGPEIPSGMLTPGELMPASMATGQFATAAALPPAMGQPAPDAGTRVNVDLTMNIDGVFSEGDLVSTVQRRVVPIIHETWNANVAGTRTQARDVLGVA